jgi:hypothetical protein
MVDQVPDKLPYDHDKFVNREEILEIVLQKARRIADGLPVERRVVIFHGQRGSGKTWLLRELEWRLDNEDIAIPAYINLLALWKEAEESVGFAMDAVLARLRSARRLEDKPARLEAQVKKVMSGAPIVLLVDHVEEASQLNKLLEERLLVPLVVEPQVFIVLAGRGPRYYWAAPELREHSEEYDLEPFGLTDVEEQAWKQVPGAAARAVTIKSLGGGHPWSTYILARLLPAKRAALEQCATLFLQDAGEHMRSHFEALSVLRAFDETRMAPLLRAYSLAFANRTWEYAACHKVREDLVATALARWSGEARGYVLDEPLRLVLEAALRERDFELWVRLHCVAYQLYADWTERYEQSREWWAQEAQYHASRLKDAGRSPEDCPEVREGA